MINSDNYPKRYAAVDMDAITKDLDPLILSAAKEVDVTLIHFLLEMSPLARVDWSYDTYMTIAGMRNDA